MDGIDELKAKIRNLHEQGEISDEAAHKLLCDEGDRDLGEEVEKIIQESIEMGDRGAPSPPEGQRVSAMNATKTQSGVRATNGYARNIKVSSSRRGTVNSDVA